MVMTWMSVDIERGNITPPPLTNTTLNPCGLAAEEGPPINYGLTERLIILLVLVFLMALTAAGNCLVVCSIMLYRQMRTRTNFFVLSLGVADTLVALLVMPFGAYQLFTNTKWELTTHVCLIATCMDVMMTTTSILHLSCLAMDRYFAICNPFFYHERMNKKVTICLIISCWIVPSFMSWLPLSVGWNETGIEDIVACRTPPDGKTCNFMVNIPYALVCSVIAFYIPCAFMIVVNTRIYKEARKQAKAIRSLDIYKRQHNHQNHNTTPSKNGHHHRKDYRNKRNMRHERKAAKTLTIIMGAFCVCWCPFFIFNVLDPIIGYLIPFHVWQLALWLGYINSTLNPFLYYFFNRHFRRAFNKILRCYRCRGRSDSSDMIVTAASQVSD